MRNKVPQAPLQAEFWKPIHQCQHQALDPPMANRCQSFYPTIAGSKWLQWGMSPNGVPHNLLFPYSRFMAISYCSLLKIIISELRIPIYEPSQWIHGNATLPHLPSVWHVGRWTDLRIFTASTLSRLVLAHDFFQLLFVNQLICRKNARKPLETKVNQPFYRISSCNQLRWLWWCKCHPLNCPGSPIYPCSHLVPPGLCRLRVRFPNTWRLLL